jgi:hypothetical protein
MMRMSSRLSLALFSALNIAAGCAQHEAGSSQEWEVAVRFSPDRVEEMAARPTPSLAPAETRWSDVFVSSMQAHYQDIALRELLSVAASRGWITSVDYNECVGGGGTFTDKGRVLVIVNRVLRDHRAEVSRDARLVAVLDLAARPNQGMSPLAFRRTAPGIYAPSEGPDGFWNALESALDGGVRAPKSDARESPKGDTALSSRVRVPGGPSAGDRQFSEYRHVTVAAAVGGGSQWVDPLGGDTQGIMFVNLPQDLTRGGSVYYLGGYKAGTGDDVSGSGDVWMGVLPVNFEKTLLNDPYYLTALASTSRGPTGIPEDRVHSLGDDRYYVKYPEEKGERSVVGALRRGRIVIFVSGASTSRATKFLARRFEPLLRSLKVVESAYSGPVSANPAQK